MHRLEGLGRNETPSVNNQHNAPFLRVLFMLSWNHHHSSRKDKISLSEHCRYTPTPHIHTHIRISTVTSEAFIYRTVLGSGL